MERFNLQKVNSVEVNSIKLQS